jgi:hypothetical protein
MAKILTYKEDTPIKIEFDSYTTLYWLDHDINLVFDLVPTL